MALPNETRHIKLRMHHARVLMDTLTARIQALEGRARDPMAQYGKKEDEELGLLREIFAQLC